MNENRRGKSKRNYSETKLSKEGFWRKSHLNKRKEECFCRNYRENKSRSRWEGRITAKRSRKGNNREESSFNNSRRPTEYFDHPT